MGLETSFNFIDDLDTTNPAAGDNVSQGDDHLRGIKNAVKGSFTSLGSAAVTATAAELNIMDGVTKTTAEINNGAQITIDTALATTSGTTKDFTIPSWAKKITVIFDEVSMNAIGYIGVQLGDSGGIEATGYNVHVNTTLVSQAFYGPVTHTDRFAVSKDTLPTAGTITGHLVLTNISSNTWVGTGLTGDTTTEDSNFIFGRKALSGTLTTVRVMVNTGAFDAGNVNVIYEG